MSPEELSDRIWDFAARVAKVVDALPDTRVGRHVAGQLCRCGTSCAANYDEACGGESKADFIHKVHVAWKELRESRGWLRFIAKVGLMKANRVANLVDEAEQLSRILAASLASVKGTRHKPTSTLKSANQERIGNF